MAEELKNTEEMVQEPENTKTSEEVIQDSEAPQAAASEPEKKIEQEESQKETQEQTKAQGQFQETADGQGTANGQGTARTQRRWRGGRLHFGEEEDLFFRDEEIISKLEGEDLLKYLSMEQEKEEMRQNAREVRERRIFSGFQLTVSLAAIVAIVGFLKDDPTVLVNILYIIGIITVLWILRRKDK